MSWSRESWTKWVVRVVALLFVVHGGLLALSEGASADSMRRDQFGNVLCLASADSGHSDDSDSSNDHSKAAACCTLGCAMFAGWVTPSVTPTAPTDAFEPAQPARFRSFADVLASVPDTPRTTRGPPATA